MYFLIAWTLHNLKRFFNDIMPKFWNLFFKYIWEIKSYAYLMNFPNNKFNETVLAIIAKHCYPKMEMKSNPFICFCKNKMNVNNNNLHTVRHIKHVCIFILKILFLIEDTQLKQLGFILLYTQLESISQSGDCFTPWRG